MSFLIHMFFHDSFFLFIHKHFHDPHILYLLTSATPSSRASVHPRRFFICQEILSRHNKKTEASERYFGLKSCLADLNRRPPPYQGDALPTEPRQHTYFFLSHNYVFYQISFSLSILFCFFLIFFKKPPDLSQFLSMAGTSRFIPASFRGFYSGSFEEHYQWI